MVVHPLGSVDGFDDTRLEEKTHVYDILGVPVLNQSRTGNTLLEACVSKEPDNKDVALVKIGGVILGIEVLW